MTNEAARRALGTIRPIAQLLLIEPRAIDDYLFLDDQAIPAAGRTTYDIVMDALGYLFLERCQPHMQISIDPETENAIRQRFCEITMVDAIKDELDKTEEDRIAKLEEEDKGLKDGTIDPELSISSNKRAFLSTPIDPEQLSPNVDNLLYVDPRADAVKGCPNVITGHFGFRSEYFMYFQRVAEMIKEGTEWGKKARIVLEYDPQQKLMQIMTLMDRDEAKTLERFEGLY